MENEEQSQPAAMPRITIAELKNISEDLDHLAKQTYKIAQNNGNSQDTFVLAMRLVYLNQCTMMNACSAILQYLINTKEDFGEKA